MDPVKSVTFEILERVIHPLASAYRRDDVEEIAVCAPGEMFCKMRRPNPDGSLWQHTPDPRLTHQYLLDCLHTISNIYNLDFHPQTSPTLYATLRKADRVTAIAGSHVMYDQAMPEGGVAINIRCQPDGAKYQLQDWDVHPGQILPTSRQHNSPLRKIRKNNWGAYEAIYDAALKGCPIIVSGPTGSGKTSLFNLLLSELSLHQRVITVQDTPELEVRSPNRVHLMIPRTLPENPPFDARKAVDLLMRMTPDVVVVGEISTSNAAMALELMKSGHSHFWTSIHAGYPDEALEAFADRVRHVLKEDKKEDIIEQIRQRAIIIQTSQDSKGNRKITHVQEPTGTPHASNPPTS